MSDESPPRRSTDDPHEDYTPFRTPRWLMILQIILLRVLGGAILVYQLLNRETTFSQRFTFVAVGLLLLLTSELMRPGDVVKFVRALRGLNGASRAE